MKTTLTQIQDFLALKRIALVGLSHNSHDFSRGLYKELLNRGYNVVPVNPNVDKINGQNCYSTVQEIEPAVDGALLLNPPALTEQIVLACVETGIKHIWIHNPKVLTTFSGETLEVCKKNGINLITGQCPHMFLSDTGFGHKLHGWILKLFGQFPRA